MSDNGYDTSVNSFDSCAQWGGLEKPVNLFARSLLLVMTFVLSCSPSGLAETATDAKGKVLVVFIYDPHCQFTCDKVRPAVRQVQSAHADSVSYVEIDTSDEHAEQSKALAQKNGVLWFFNDNMKFVPVVGFFSPQRKCIKYLTGPKTKDVYEAALVKAMKTK